MLDITFYFYDVDVYLLGNSFFFEGILNSTDARRLLTRCAGAADGFSSNYDDDDGEEDGKNNSDNGG